MTQLDAALRMVGMVYRLDEIEARILHTRRQIGRAYASLCRPAANVPLIGAHILRLKGRHSKLLAELREVEEEAAGMLGRAPAPREETIPCPASTN